MRNSCSSYLQLISAFKGLFPLGSNDGSDSLAAEITTPEMRYVCVYMFLTICFCTGLIILNEREEYDGQIQ